MVGKKEAPYLPPPVGVLREHAALLRHERMEGLVEPLGEPGVVLQVSYAASAATGPSGEEAARQSEGVLEEVARRIAERVVEEHHGERNDAEEEGQGPHFPQLEQRHGAARHSEGAALRTARPRGGWGKEGGRKGGEEGWREG